MEEIGTPITEKQGKSAITKINARLKRVKTPHRWTCGKEDFLGLYRFLMRQDNHPWQSALKSVLEHTETIKAYVIQEYPEMISVAA